MRLVAPALHLLNDAWLVPHSGEFGGLFARASLFARRYHIYSPPEPGFWLISDTLTAFETVEQQSQWFEVGGGLEAAASVYRYAGVVPIAVLPARPLHLVVDRFLAGIADLRGLRITTWRGLGADLLARLGAEPLHEDVPGTPEQRARGPENGRITSAGRPPDGGFVLDVPPLSMPTVDISLTARVWEMLSPDQRALLRQHVRSYTGTVRSFISDADDAWFGRLAGLPVGRTSWSEAERHQLRLITSQFLREWASHGPPYREGGRSSSRQDLVESLERFQRSVGLL